MFLRVPVLRRLRLIGVRLPLGLVVSWQGGQVLLGVLLVGLVVFVAVVVSEDVGQLLAVALGGLQELVAGVSLPVAAGGLGERVDGFPGGLHVGVQLICKGRHD